MQLHQVLRMVSLDKYSIVVQKQMIICYRSFLINFFVVYHRFSVRCTSQLSNDNCCSCAVRICHACRPNHTTTGSLCCSIISSCTTTSRTLGCSSCHHSTTTAAAESNERYSSWLYGCAHSQWWLCSAWSSIHNAINSGDATSSICFTCTTPVYSDQCGWSPDRDCCTTSRSYGRCTTTTSCLSICWTTNYTSSSNTIYSIAS